MAQERCIYIYIYIDRPVRTYDQYIVVLHHLILMNLPSPSSKQARKGWVGGWVPGGPLLCPSSIRKLHGYKSLSEF